MKKTVIMTTVLALCLVIFIGVGMAQRDYRQTNTQTYAQRGGNNQSRGFRPPPHPLMTALDTNRDQVISAEEIQNASKALLTLDKNKDGKLTHDEIRPKFPGSRSSQGQSRARSK